MKKRKGNMTKIIIFRVSDEEFARFEKAIGKVSRSVSNGMRVAMHLYSNKILK